jgi:hypothetical protein
MLKNLQIQERWSNQKKLKASSDDLRLLAKQTAKTFKAENELRVGVKNTVFAYFKRAVYDAQPWRHGCARKNFTDELLKPDHCHQTTRW